MVTVVLFGVRVVACLRLVLGRVPHAGQSGGHNTAERELVLRVTNTKLLEPLGAVEGEEEGTGGA